MSFLKRFFEHIEVSSPAGVGEVVFAKRLAFTALAIAVGAAALIQAPAFGSLAYDKLELHRIGQPMVGTHPGEISPEERLLAQESIRFYRRFLAKGEGPGELRIEVSDIPKSAPSIFLAGRLVQSSDQWTVNMPDRCVLQLRSADMEGLSNGPRNAGRREQSSQSRLGRPAQPKNVRRRNRFARLLSRLFFGAKSRSRLAMSELGSYSSVVG